MSLDQYTVIVRQAGLHYVALCLELNVASRGDSPTQVRQNIADAIREYLAYMEEIDATEASFRRNTPPCLETTGLHQRRN